MIGKTLGKLSTIIIFSALFCGSSFAAVNKINTGQTQLASGLDFTSTPDTVNFDGASGTLSADSGYTLDSISTDTNGVGILAFNNPFISGQVNGDIGSANNKIDSITSSSGVFFTTLNISGGSLYVANGIKGDSQFKLSINGAGTHIVDASIGESGKSLRLVEVATANSDTRFSGVDFYTNLFTTAANTKATINHTGTISLGGVTNSGTLNLNENASISSLSLASTGILNIANGKTATITGSGATTFNNGTFNTIVNTSAASPNLNFTAGSNVSFNTGFTIDFDYASGTGAAQGETYNLMTTTGTMSATNLANVTLTDNSFLLNPALSVSGSNLVVTSNIDTANKALITGSNLTLLNNINSQSGSGGNIAALNSSLLGATSQASVESSLKSINGNDGNMVSNASVNITNRVDNVINSRLSTIIFSDKKGFSSGNNKFTNNSIWGQIVSGSAKQNNTSDRDGYDSKSYAIVFGGDKILTKDDGKETVIGIAASYGVTNVDSENSQSTDINSYQLSFYNNNFLGKDRLGLYNDNIVSLAYHQYDSSRTITAGTTRLNANSSYDAIQYGLKAGLGYNVEVKEKTIISPNASLKYLSLNQSDYQETGAGNAGLIVSNDAFNNLVLDVGIKGAFKDFKIFDKPILPQASLSWSKNLITDGQESTSSFISGGSSFSSNTGDLDEDYLNLGFRFDIELSQDSTLIFDYDIQKSDSFTSHTRYLKYRLAF